VNNIHTHKKARVTVTALWHVMPCNLVEVYGHFGGTCRVHRHARNAILSHGTGSCG